MQNYLEITNYLIDINRINWTHHGDGSIYISFCDKDNVRIDFPKPEDASEAYKLLKEKLINA